jgi:signal transduction histidine kinase
MVVAFERRPAESPVTLHLEPVSDDLHLRGDMEKLRQLCYNILDNALKFSPRGGRVTISATPEEEYVHLAFQDEGIGIPEHQLSQIFETFYQVDGSSTRRFGGLGLGLAVVNRIVEAHQGKVWAESEINKGSIFHVLLPRDTS